LNIRTTEQIQQALVDSIRTADPTIALEDGNIVKDIVIDAPAAEFRLGYVVNKFVKFIQSVNGIALLEQDATFKSELATALAISETEITEATTITVPSTVTNDVDALIFDAINNLASNFNLTRTASSKARFIQQFFRQDNNSGSPITVPLGSTVQTIGTDPKVSTTITATAQIPTLDSVKGLFFTEETVEAELGGSSFNVAIGAIKQISPTISEATTTSNIEIAAIGQDNESNASLLDRIQASWAGKELSTVEGLSIFAKDFAGVIDAFVVDPSRDLFTRSSAGGADVYIQGNDLINDTQVVPFIIGTNQYLLEKQPATSIISVTGSISGVLSTSEFSLVEDTNSFAKSARALNKLDVSAASLTDGETLTVIYRYDKLIFDLQAAIETEANKVIAGDILFKQADQVLIDYTIDVETFSGQDPEAVITAQLSAFINGGTIGGVTYTGYVLSEDVKKTDSITQILLVEDVDSIDLDTLVIARRTGDTGLDPIVIADNEFARLGTITISSFS